MALRTSFVLREIPETLMPQPLPNVSEAFAKFDRHASREFELLGETERSTVTGLFPIKCWPNLSLEQFSLGLEPGDNTFCYFMEYKTEHLGSIRGGSARKHLIFKYN